MRTSITVAALSTASMLLVACPSTSEAPADAGLEASACARTRTCGTGESCTDDSACASGNCVSGACSASPKTSDCKNNAIDGNEEGLDCGGSCAKCDGATCAQNNECKSNLCNGGKCAPPATKTCGVGLPQSCALGARCTQDADCESDYCSSVNGYTCIAPPASSRTDGRRNGGESGIDCGGSIAATKPCAAGQGCKISDDCTGACNSTTLKCEAPSATDGKKNSDETDVDCGGPNAPACKRNKTCAVAGDCILKYCSANKCAEPSDSDGVQNGNETDKDCGGAAITEDEFSFTAGRCKFDQKCAIKADCLQGSCSAAKICVSPSCDSPNTAGIVTCGQKEVGDGTAVHESCCRSLTLPTRTTRALDKYEITAGRFRRFIESVGPNVRAWVTNYVAANPTSQLGLAVANNPVILPLYPAVERGGAMNLVAHMSFDIDNYSGIRGCYNGYDVANPAVGSSGQNTYWQNATNLTDYGIPPRVLPQAVSDAKSLNCAMPIMFAAFCAWDDAEMALLADYQDAWGPAAYPWGATDLLRPNYNWCNGLVGTGGWTCQDATLGDNGRFYQFPAGTNQLRDQSPLLAAPGRFAMDATLNTSGGEKWYDLFANLSEYTGDFQVSATNDFCDFSAAPAVGATTCTRGQRAGLTGTRHVGIPRTGIVGRSWEGHNYGRGSLSGFQATFQYGKFGARCARPAQ